MRRMMFTLALVITPLALAAQQRDTTLAEHSLPRDVAREAVRLFNGAATLRTTGPMDVAEGREIHGDVAVLNGPLTIAGHVTGRVLAIDGDVTLLPTARIDGDLLVVGGEVDGRDRAYVGGEIRVYHSRLRYTQAGDRIAAAEPDSGREEPWWRRFEHRRDESGSSFLVASAGAYNRVEGLPINLGPQMFRDFSKGSARLDAYAVVRTASSFRAGSNDVGHNLTGTLRLGPGNGFLVGAGVYDVVEPVESWGLSNLEVGLASALFRRDYRDYFQRHGGNVRAGVYARDNTTFTISYADEHWTPRAANNAWTLFRSGSPWRPNPAMDAAHFHLLNATLHVDTRTDEANPWAGWYVMADLERGRGHIDALGATGVARAYPAGRPVTYERGFLDLRRYNRISRHAQLNLRLVTGGWLGGDPLPLERRLSVDGYGSLPGFEFRTGRAGEDVSTCSVGAIPPGYPAQCDRIALGQVEYRSDLHVPLFNWDDDSWVRPHFTADGTWVVFLDAGRGWLVGNPGPPMTYTSGGMPPLGSFRSDLGVGLDFDVLGIYLAKPLSSPQLPMRLFLSLQHRF